MTPNEALTHLLDYANEAIAWRRGSDDPDDHKLISLHEQNITQARKALRPIIAAAPDLLAALVEMMREFEPVTMYQGKNEPDALILARAAIAKAVWEA